MRKGALAHAREPLMRRAGGDNFLSRPDRVRVRRPPKAVFWTDGRTALGGVEEIESIFCLVFSGRAKGEVSQGEGVRRPRPPNPRLFAGRTDAREPLGVSAYNKRTPPFLFYLPKRLVHSIVRAWKPTSPTQRFEPLPPVPRLSSWRTLRRRLRSLTATAPRRSSSALGIP